MIKNFQKINRLAWVLLVVLLCVSCSPDIHTSSPTPEVLDSAYLSKYFDNIVYGKESAKYLKERIDYNKDTI